MQRLGGSISLMLVAVLLPKMADAQVVLKGSDLTESALIDALTPHAGTRNLARDPPPPAARNPAASILLTSETNSTEPTPQAKGELDVVARAPASNRLTECNFLLEGHADPRGTAEDNQWRSESRAPTVLDDLIVITGSTCRAGSRSARATVRR